MSLKDEILSDLPISYYTLSGGSGNTDISGNSNNISSGYAATSYFPIVPGLTPGTLSAASITNDRKIMQPGYEDAAFSIEFVIQPYTTPLTNSTLSAQTITNIAVVGSSGVSYYRDRFRFSIDGTSPSHVDAFAPQKNNRYHVVAIYTGSTFYLIVNGVISDLQQVPDNFTFATVSSAIVCTSTVISNLAIYDRPLSSAVVARHYQSSQFEHSHANLSIADGAQYIECVNDVTTMDRKIFRLDDVPPDARNLVTNQYGRITLPLVNDIVYVGGTPAYSNGITLGSGKYLYKDNLGSLLSSSSGYIAGKFTVSSNPGAKQYMVTIYNPAIRTYWSWYINTSGIPSIDVVVIDGDDAATTTTYAYTTAISTGSRNIAILFNSGYVSLYSDGAANALNAYSGSSTIPLDVRVDNETIAYIGVGYQLTGLPSTTVANLAFGKSYPASPEWGGTYTDLTDATLGLKPAACMYTFGGTTGLAASQRGFMTIRPTLEPSQTDSGGVPSVIDDTYFKMIAVEESTIQPAATLTTSGVPRTGTVYSGQEISVITNGDVPGTNYNVYGLSLDIELLAADSELWRPEIESIDLRTYSNRSTYSINSAARIDAVSSVGHRFISSGDLLSTDPSAESGLLVRTSGPGFKVVNPGVDGSTNKYLYGAIEFLYYAEYDAGIGTTEILCINNPASAGTEKSIVRTASGLTPTTGSVFASVYLNGTSISLGSATVPIYNTWNHIVANITTPVNAHQVFFNCHYDGTKISKLSGYDNIGLYNNQLTATQVQDHYSAAKGLITKPIGDVETLSMAENIEPVPYSYSWSVGSTV